MRKSLLQHVVVPELIACLFTFAPFGCSGQDEDVPDPDSGPRAPRAETLPVYDESKVLDFKLTFTPAEWDVFQQVYKNPPPPSLRDTYTKVYAHCSFEALGVKFADAACRPKGNPSYWKDEKKPQFAIKFDHWDEKGRFLTLRRLNLEASPFAAAPVRDRLGMWVMREAGIKAPRANHVRVHKNGELLGLYMNIEEIDKEFVQSQFVDSTGNLYSQGQFLETNKKMSDTSRLYDLTDLLENEPLDGNHDSFFAEIKKRVNIPAMLSETAAEVVLPTGDNWSNGGTNYFYYDSPASGKFYLLPWDLDTIMDAGLAPANADPYSFWGQPSLELAPNKLLQLLYQNPEWKQSFDDAVVEIRDTVYNRLPARIDEVCAQIRSDFIADPHGASQPEDFDRDCAFLKKHVAARTAYLTQKLGR